MEFDDLAKLVKSRHSVRRWQEKRVPEELLLQAIELATWAPNGGNQQNWHFYVILNQETIKAIADAVQARADLMASWSEATLPESMAARQRRRAGFFSEAPAAIAVAAARYNSSVDVVLTSREKTDPQAQLMRQWRTIANSRIQSVASAIAYLLLILHQVGLGAVWMTGPMQAKGDLEKILQVPPDLDLVAFIPVGYPAENPVPRERRPIKEICQVIH